MTKRIVPFEVKAETFDAETGSFAGYGSVWNTIDSYSDTIQKGAFKGTLKEWKGKKKLPKMLLQHGGGFFGGSVDDLVPIGQWTEMREDDHGLYCEGRLFMVETDRVRATYAAMKAGELDGLSIGFNTKKSKRDSDTGVRTLTEIDLWECSIVTFPANAPALIDAVKSAGDLPTEREFERWLQREAGFSDSQVKTIVSKGYRQLQREAATAGSLNDLLESVRRFAPSGE